MVSDETRRKMSESAKRRAADPEYRKAMSERAKAQMAQPGAKERLSESTKKQFADPEKKKAMQDAQRQSLQSPEVRAKMSESAKKKYADPVKGKSARDAVKEAMGRPEVRQKMSESANKRWEDVEQRKAASEATKVQMSDPEMRNRAIQSAKDYWDDDARERKSEQMKQIYAETDLAERVSQATREAMKGIIYSPEFIELRRKNMEARWSDPVQRELLADAIREAYESEEVKARWEEAMKILRATPEYRENLSKGGKQYWDSLSSEDREARIEAILSAQKYFGTAIELIVGSLLDALNVSYKPQWFIGGFSIDFYVPEKRLMIECDGDYWHSLPGAKERDNRKDEYLRQKGYRILRLSESQIHRGDFDALYEMLH